MSLKIKPLHNLFTGLLALTLCLALSPARIALADSPALPQGSAASVQPPQARQDLIITSLATGQDHGFSLELAITSDQWARGLMFRRYLPADHGMLFVATDHPRQTSFWMRNTLIELDMIFIAPGWRIGHIHHRAQPLDETGISSQGRVVAVLEVAGGRAEALGLKPGDKISISPEIAAQFPPCRIACQAP
ncbi:MAG: hypothetical protein Alpg2KO_09150 [Alphaproteobacteria bacterium]